jgi:stress response protein SCP2
MRLFWSALPWVSAWRSAVLRLSIGPLASIRPSRPTSGDGERAIGESLLLEGTSAPTLTRIRFLHRAGPPWPPLDIGCIAYSGELAVVDSVWSQRRKGLRGALRREIEPIRQQGEGHAEQYVEIDVGAVPPNVRAFALTVNSPTGPGFSQPLPMRVELADHASAARVAARFDLPADPARTGVIACRINHTARGWLLTIINVFQDGKTVRAMVGPAKRML